MSGTRLKGFIITVRNDRSPNETFYILAKDVEQARARAVGLARQKSVAGEHVAAAERSALSVR